MRLEGSTALSIFHSLSQQKAERRSEKRDRRGNGGECPPVFSGVRRQIADHFAGLPVHGKEEALAVPARREHPHRQQRIMHLAAAQPDVLRAGNTRVIPAYGAPERVQHRFPAALVGAAFAVGDRNIVLIREKAGEICMRGYEPGLHRIRSAECAA